MRTGKKVFGGAFLLFCLAIQPVHADEPSPGPVISELCYPELTDRESIVITGKLDGKPFEIRQPMAEAPGEYRLVVKVVDLSGHESSREITVVKLATLPRGMERVHRDVPLAQAAAGRTVSAPAEITLEGDYALILSVSDGLGRRSSQVVTVERPSPVKLIWKGRIREVWTLFKNSAGRVMRALKFTVRNSAPTVVRGSIGPDSSSALVSTESSGSRPEAARRPETTALVSGVKGVPSAPPSKLSSAEKFSVPESSAGAAPPSTLSSDAEAAKKNPEDASKDMNFTETHVRIPDERGGMTITIDNFRTGKRLIIHKDSAGNETGRSEIEVPGLRRPEKKKAPGPSTPDSP